MGMADANKRINLAAPLISVRRHHAGAGGEAPVAVLPAYKADATSGPLGHAGAAVPFGWEHRPGHPKSVRTRRPPLPPPAPPLTLADEPPRAAREPAAVIVASGRAREHDERCSDARDDVSCVTANCSAAGLSDAASACAARARPGPCARGGVMMDRFLPAAHAVAAGSPQNAFRKAGYSARPAVAMAAPCARGDGGDRMPAQRRLPFRDIAAYQYHLAPLSPEGKNVDDDGDGAESVSDGHSTAGFASRRRCGLLPTRCVKGALLLSRGARRAADRPFLSNGGGRSLKEANPLLRCSRNGQQQPQRTGDDPGAAMQSWEEVNVKSLLRSGGGGGLMGPAAAVASELDRTVRELYKRRGGQAVHLKPKASHLGLLLVLDRSNEACGHQSSPARKLSRTGDTASSLLPVTTQKGSPDAEKQPRRGDTGELPGDKEAVAGRELALCPQPPLPAFPLPKSPTESWLSRALPSVTTRPPATSFLGIHVQPKKHAPLPWYTIDSGKDRS
ncbi:hypothetical protein U9M48_044561 [Paspalum notatum var. saurae]|uniref:Uncharacterized protein n=1 Tax=Paspalum notatum var. saurae TaxID=547442 RepID=A0AAQ3UZJ1_PASNO